MYQPKIVATVGLLASFWGTAALAAERPDFTGVWGNYRDPAAGAPQRGAPQAALPLRPEAQKKVDAYRALVAPNQDTPGGFCLGTTCTCLPCQ